MDKNKIYMQTLTILSLEDSYRDFEIIRESLINAEYNLKIDLVDNEKDFEKALNTQKYDLVLSDFNLPGYDAFEALKKSLKICPNIPFIVVSGSVGEETVIELIKKGAHDYVLKDNLERLKFAVKRALSDAKKMEAHRHAEAELQKSNELNKYLLQTIPFGIDIVDTTGTILFINENLQKKFDIDLIGKKCWDLYKDDKEQCDDCPIKNGIAIGETFSIETDKILEGRSFQITHTGILFEGKEAILEIFQDITTRKQAEENVKILSMAVEQNPASIIITNPEGLIEYVNPKFCEISGYTFEEMIGQYPRILSTGEKPKEEYGKLWNTILSNNIWRGEFHNKKKDGSLFWETAVISPINNEKGEITHFVAVKEDITEKKMMIRELVIAKEKAEKSDKLKTEFLAQMSHEIRTPLNVIISSVSYIKSEVEDKVGEEEYGLFESIELSSQRIIRTISLILNVSELQLGIYKPILTNIDIDSSILSPLFKEHKKIATNKNLQFIYKCNAEQKHITADEYSISQIFANLIDNALKYTHDGKVEILVSNNSNGELIVEIKDTGIGMSKEFHSNIFEPFVQEYTGYSRAYDGNGLGLSLVKKYCDVNIAIIEVESEKGVGSTFKVIFKNSSNNSIS
jgi:PAS domain S-box-containing protein